MKKILIVSHAMELGGAERALLGLLETIDTSKVEVDLFLLRHRGELMKYIPKNIHLLPENVNYSCMGIPLVDVLKKGKIRIAIGRTWAKLAADRTIKKLHLGDNDVHLEYSHKYTYKYMPMISDKLYDLAISFLTPHYFVAEKVNAKKKIAWIHTDYSVLEVDEKSQLKMWSNYDIIASISKKVTEGFLKRFPQLENKIEEIQNVMPVSLMHSLASKEIPIDEFHSDCIKLLSIGRFCPAKNFDNVPSICSYLVKKNINFVWYLIGYGGDEPLIRQRIFEENMENHVVILGKKENPYPYIRMCDFYIQPSRYEGKCVSVIEAQILGKPVIITDYATASSQLRHGVDGVIVPLDNEKCAEGIYSVIQDNNLQRKLMANCELTDYSNSFFVNKLYTIIEGD